MFPNWNKIKGISYSEPTLTFKKDEYTGKTTDGKDAKVQIVATVSLAGYDCTSSEINSRCKYQ